MAVEIVMPRLGWTMEEGTLVEWLKKPGETVQAGEVLFTVETDKAINEVESFDAGRLHIPGDAPGPGATVPVGTVLGFLLAEGEEPPASVQAPAAGSGAGAAPAAPSAGGVPKGAAGRPGAEAAAPAGSAPPPGSDADAASPPASSAAPPDASNAPMSAGGEPAGGAKAPTSEAGSAPPGAAPSAAPAISPRARRLAQQLGIDWRKVRGTGRTGRITEDDVRAAAADQAAGGGSTEP